MSTGWLDKFLKRHNLGHNSIKQASQALSSENGQGLEKSIDNAKNTESGENALLKEEEDTPRPLSPMNYLQWIVGACSSIHENVTNFK